MANSKKTQDKRRGASVFAAVLILCALIGGVCLCGYVSRNDSGKWFTNPNLSTWHWVDELAYDGDAVVGVQNHSVHNHATSLKLDDDENAEIAPYAAPLSGTYTTTKYDNCPSCEYGTLTSGGVISPADCVHGRSQYYSCEDCGWSYNYLLSTVTDPNNHDWDKPQQITAPTCVEEGSALYTCLQCSKTETRSVPATGEHSYSWVITTKPVGNTGGVESYICGSCSDVTETRTVFALPAEPEKEGYHFVGWYTDEAFTNPYNSDYIYSDTNLYAKFEINICKVTFDSAGGSEIDGISVEWNTAISPEAPEKTGYNFLGWYKSDGSKFEDGDLITRDTVLSARWQIKTFTVTFYVNGELYATVTVEYGSVLSKVADDAAVYANNILSFENVNGETPAVSANEMIIADDMVVMANEPSIIERIFKSKYMPYAIGGACALMLVAGAIIAGVAKKKRG